jgi:hypothetical protein
MKKNERTMSLAITEFQKLLHETKDFIESSSQKNLFLTDEEIAFFSHELKEQTSFEKNFSHKVESEKSNSLPLTYKEKENKNFSSPSFTLKPKQLPETKPLPELLKKQKEEKPFKKSLIKTSLPVEKPNPHLDFITLEKPTRNEVSLEKTRKIIEEIAPNYPLLLNVPNDEKAKQIALGYQLKKQSAEVTILSYKESPQGLLFLKNLALAIENCFLPAKVVSAAEIEQENKWEMLLTQGDLKLIIGSDYSIWELAHLIPHYKEIPAKNEHFLGDIPLFMLPDISLYLKEPLLKKSLFAALKKKISSITKI